MKNKIITITLNPALDKNATIEELIPEIKLRCENPSYDPGGGGINVSRVLRRLGLNPETLYPVGGQNGDILSTLLENEGINIHPIKSTKPTRENFNVIESKKHNQYRFCMPGHKLESEFYRQLYMKIKKCHENDIVVISGSMPPEIPKDFFSMIANICNHNKIKLVIDTSGKSLKMAIQHRVYLIKPNIQELAELLEIGKLKINETVLGARKIVSEGKVENILLTNGAKGAWWISKGKEYYIKPPIVKIKSTIGAGDSAIAGALFGTMKNLPIEDILAIAIAAGTATTLQKGTSLGSLKDIQKIFKSIQKRGKLIHM